MCFDLSSFLRSRRYIVAVKPLNHHYVEGAPYPVALGIRIGRLLTRALTSCGKGFVRGRLIFYVLMSNAILFLTNAGNAADNETDKRSFSLEVSRPIHSAYPSGAVPLDRYGSGYNTYMGSDPNLEIDSKRREVSARLDPKKRSNLGQFMTPSTVASFMASLFQQWPKEVRLLDPGAGIGSLTEAYFEQFLRRAPDGASVNVTAYEIDPTLLGYLREHLDSLAKRASVSGRIFSSEIDPRDFIAEGTFALGLGAKGRFTHALLNPPYKKINTGSPHRKLLSSVGIETVNLYSAFLALAVALTEEGGEIVAIVPRSFCNGTYFRPFRTWLLERVAIHHIHVFESRRTTFRDDAVLQENVIVRLGRGQTQGSVIVSSSNGPTFADYSERRVSFDEIVKPSDPERFIRVPIKELQESAFPFTGLLREMGINVATGPVVDFRVREHWLQKPRSGAVPLLYAHHFVGGELSWPREHKKPNALALNEDTRRWLMPRGYYCVTRRFSAKEERRRVVAYVVEPERLTSDLVGFENHLNVFNVNKSGLPAEIAYGLAVFLNSTAVDQFFRTFSGHTQVNASDLRALKYPSTATLGSLGEWAMKNRGATQEQIDQAVARHGG